MTRSIDKIKKVNYRLNRLSKWRVKLLNDIALAQFEKKDIKEQRGITPEILIEIGETIDR